MKDVSSRMTKKSVGLLKRLIKLKTIFLHKINLVVLKYVVPQKIALVTSLILKFKYSYF